MCVRVVEKERALQVFDYHAGIKGLMAISQEGMNELPFFSRAEINNRVLCDGALSIMKAFFLCVCVRVFAEKLG